MIIIFATILSISAPTGPLLRAGKPDDVLVWLSMCLLSVANLFTFHLHKCTLTLHSLVVWRIVLGIGVGADYPMSASVSTDRVSVRKRGTMLAYVFANQVGRHFFFAFHSSNVLKQITNFSYFFFLTGLGFLRRQSGNHDHPRGL